MMGGTNPDGSVGVDLDLDGALEIGAIEVDPSLLVAVKDLGVGVTETVMTSGGDDGDPGLEMLQKCLLAGGAGAVMRGFQDGPTAREGGGEPGFAGGFEIAGEEDTGAGVGESGDQAAVVGIEEVGLQGRA